MFLARFTVPRAALYRLYVDARLDRDSAAAVATATTTTTPASSLRSWAGELSSRLKRLCPLRVVETLHESPGAPAARRLEMDFADYLAVCGGGARHSCHCDERADVSMGRLTRPIHTARHHAVRPAVELRR